MADPLHQFEIKPLIDLTVAGVDISFTNSSLFMMLAVICCCALMLMSTRKTALVPGRWQSLAEILYNFIANMIRDASGAKAKPFFPFVFTLFMFLLFGNLLGMVPVVSFTFTSHIAVTFVLAMLVFVMVTILGFAKHGLHFFHFFLPPGVPAVLAPLMIVIELLAYLARPITLSLRLFINMMAGHLMLKVFAGFTVMLVAGMGGLGFAIGILPLAFNVALTTFEVFVAMLQAYIFSILTCVYIRDALELH